MVAIKAEAAFSLKDDLFNAESVAELSRGLKLAYRRFDRKGFEGQVLRRFPELELKERINWMADSLVSFLPGEVVAQDEFECLDR